MRQGGREERIEEERVGGIYGGRMGGSEGRDEKREGWGRRGKEGDTQIMHCKRNNFQQTRLVQLKWTLSYVVLPEGERD